MFRQFFTFFFNFFLIFLFFYLGPVSDRIGPYWAKSENEEKKKKSVTDERAAMSTATQRVCVYRTQVRQPNRCTRAFQAPAELRLP